MLSNAAPSAIFWVIDITRPGIEPRWRTVPEHSTHYIHIKVSKFGHQSRGRPEGSIFYCYYSEVLGRALLLSLDCSTLPSIHILYRRVISKEVSSTIFKVFGMTRPGIEPKSPGPLANTLPMSFSSSPLDSGQHYPLKAFDMLTLAWSKFVLCVCHQDDVKSGGFRFQLEALRMSSHIEELWYKETDYLWMTKYMYLFRGAL